MARPLTPDQLIAQAATPFWTKANDWKTVPAAATAGTAKLELPTGVTLHEILIHLEDSTDDRTEAEMKTDIDELTLKIDGSPLWSLPGYAAVELAEFYVPGSVANGNLHIFLHRPWMELILTQDAPAWGLVGKTSAILEMKLAGAHAVASVSSQIKTSEPEELGEWIEVVKFSPTYSATGEDTIDLPRDESGLTELCAIHLREASHDISNLELSFNKVTFFEGAPDEVHAMYGPYGREIQANLVSLDLCHRGRDIDAVPLNVQQGKLKVTWGTAPSSYDVILELVHRVKTRAQRIEEARARVAA